MNLEEARKLADESLKIHYRPRKPSDISNAGIRAQRLAETVLELADEVERLEAALEDYVDLTFPEEDNGPTQA